MRNPNSTLIPAIKRQIDRIKNRDGEFDLDAVVQFADALGYAFDEKKAKNQEVARFCRQIIATYRDKDGDRTILATGRTGEFIDRQRCKNKEKLNAAINSMTEKRDGLDRTIRKTQRQVDGQLSFYSASEGETINVGL